MDDVLFQKLNVHSIDTFRLRVNERVLPRERFTPVSTIHCIYIEKNTYVGDV